MIITNAFSLNMLPNCDSTIRILAITPEKAKALLESEWLNLVNESAMSAIGHQETADLVAKQLGLPIVMNRRTIGLSAGNRCIVAQYIGPRLPEGATELPSGAEIRYKLVIVDD